MAERMDSNKRRGSLRVFATMLAVLLILCACAGPEPSNTVTGKSAQTEEKENSSQGESVTKGLSLNLQNEGEKGTDILNEALGNPGNQERESDIDRSIHMVLSGTERSLPKKSENMTAPDLETGNDEVYQIQEIQDLNSEKKDYTIMVYMIGSTLEYEDGVGYIGAATADIEEMLSSGVDYDLVNVIIYTGGTVSWANGLPAYVNCVLDLSQYKGDGDLTSAIVAIHQNEPSMGNPHTLSAFINFCTDYYPAENTGLILWDHGNGPLYGYGQDALHSDDSLLLPEMKTALSETEFAESSKLVFVGFDACLMASLENAAIWKDYAEYLVASEEKEPGIGWDYTFLGNISNIKEGRELVKDIVESSGVAFSNLRSDYTLSAMELSRVSSVVEAFDELFDKVNQSDEAVSQSVLQQRTNIKEFGRAEGGDYANSELIDLASFCRQLSDSFPDETDSLVTAINKMVVIQKSNLEEAGGVSVYYPFREMQLYHNVFENYYKIVNPSSNYETFLQNYVRKWQNGSVIFENEDGVLGEAPATPEGSIVFPLTQMQMSVFGTAAYTVFEVRENDEDQEDYYLPVLANVQISPDEYGRLLVPADPQLICNQEGTGGYPYPYRAWQIAHESSRDVYQVMDAFLTADRLDYDFINTTSLPVSFRIVREEDGSFQSQDIVTLTDDVSGSGRQEPDLSHYEALAIIGESYIPKMAENGYYLPIETWEESSSYWGEVCSFKGDFPAVSVNCSKFDTEYVVQITYTDIYGNIGTSGFVPLEKKEQFCGIETEGGMLRFRMESDHAELIGYEGHDYEIEIPAQAENKPVTVVGDYVFTDCESIRKITLPESMITIGRGAFAKCTNLKQIFMPDTLKEILSHAFQDCTAFENIVLPESLEELSDLAFSGCSSLQSIRLPAGLRKLGNGVFSRCMALEKIDVDPDCQACRLTDQMLLSLDGKELLGVPQGGGTYLRIPEGVETIGYAALSGFTELKRVEFPKTLKTIRNYAFWECSNLDDLQLPDGLKTIGAYAFGGIWDNNFDGTPDRGIGKPLFIGKNVDYIGPYAFEGTCTEEINVDPENKVYSSRDGFLMDKSGIIAFEIPTGQIKYGEITIPEGIVGIRDNLFRGNYSLMLSGYYLPASLTYIPTESLPYYDDDITIFAPSGSNAEKYADILGVSFRATD